MNRRRRGLASCNGSARRGPIARRSSRPCICPRPPAARPGRGSSSFAVRAITTSVIVGQNHRPTSPQPLGGPCRQTRRPRPLPAATWPLTCWKNDRAPSGRPRGARRAAVRRLFLRDGAGCFPRAGWGSWGVLHPTPVIFSVIRPRHNNQPVVESGPRRERPGEGPSFGLHGQISLIFC